MANVTRADLAKAAFQESPVDMGEARSLVDQTIEAIAAALARGEPVKISGFGVFVGTRTKRRMGRNPKRPSEAHAIEPRGRVLFRYSRELAERLNPGRAVARGTSQVRGEKPPHYWRFRSSANATD